MSGPKEIRKPRAQQLLPFLQRKIGERPNLFKVINNTSWIFLDRVLRILALLVVSIWQARYLGPQQYGLLNYALALVSLFAVIGQLGLNNIVVREIASTPQQKHSVLGTAFVLQFFGGIVSFVLSIGAAFLLNPSDTLVHKLVLVIALGPMLAAFNVIDFWFQSQIKSKYTFIAKSASFILEPLLVFVLIWTKASLVSFAGVSVIVVLVSSIGLLLVYQFDEESIRYWRFRLEHARSLLSASWPLMLSAVSVVIYLKIDQILLKQMIGDEALGLYTSAVRISEVWYIVPTAIISSLFPIFVAEKKRSEEEYYKKFYLTFRFMSLLSISFAIVMMFLSDWVINTVYGADYAAAGPVLTLHVWAGLPVAMGVATSPWIITEGYTQIAFHRTLFGAMVNVVLNLILIPKYSIVGAAVATIVAYTCAGFIWHFVDSRTRHLAFMQLKALFIFIK